MYACITSYCTFAADIVNYFALCKDLSLCSTARAVLGSCGLNTPRGEEILQCFLWLLFNLFCFETKYVLGTVCFKMCKQSILYTIDVHVQTQRDEPVFKQVQAQFGQILFKLQYNILIVH